MKTRRLRQFPKRCLAIVLAFVFALSGTNVAGWQVKAADDTVTVSSAEDTAKPIHVKLTAETTIAQGKWGDNSPSEELTQYAVSVVNGTEAAISDWQLTIACSSLSTYNAGWNGVSKSGNNIVVGTYKGTDTNGEVWTNSTIAAGESANGAGFQVAARELTGATYTLTYKNGESSGSVSVDDTATDPAAIGTKSDKVTATLTKSNEDGEYHEYFLKIDNKSSDSIGDWLVAIPMTGVTKVQDWSAWAKVQAYYTSDYLYVAPVGEAVISSGGSFGSTSVGEYKFNYNGSSSPSGAVVYYKTGTSSSGAFQSVISNASGGSSSSGGSSGGSNTSLTDTTTNKNLDIEYNYAKLLQESLYFYDANMCGDEVSEKCGLNWRGDCHTSDKTVTYNGKTVDVSGGFHDAGDHVKFGLPQGYSATVLALSYYEFKEAYDELGQTDHYKTIMDHFCDYFKRCTVYNGDSVEAFCYQVGEGGPDHSYWGAPESQPVSTRGSAFFANASNPATDEVCVAAAALALHGYNFNNTEYIKVAEDLFAFAKTNSKSCATDGAGAFYSSSDWKDDYCSAAAALYVATKKDTYKNELSSYYTSGNIKTGWVLTWDNTWAVASALQEDWPLVNTFAAYGNNVTPQGYKVVDEWGSARYNTTLQFLGLVYDQGKDQFSTESGSFCSWATGQMNYLLGNNDNKRCFVVGYNENSSQYPHHRAASRSSDAGQTREDHYTLLGALVGGPKNNDVYADDQSDYNCNEVALDYNAGFVGAAAGLYLLHKNDSSVPKTLATEEELSGIGVTKYYSATPSDPGKVSSVSLNKKTLSLLKGESDTLSATVTPSTATDKSVTWKSSNESVATVDTTGKVTAVGKGTATITVTTTDGNKTATCTVTVTLPTLTLNKTTADLKVGDSVTLTATTTASGTVSWSSDATSVATVDTTGKVTAVGSGTAKIKATIGSGTNALTATCTVTVSKKTVTITTPNSLTITAGTKISEIPFDDFTAKYGTSVVDGTFQWTTTDATLTAEDDDKTLNAKFVPTNSTMYDEVTGISVTVSVQRKTYAGVPDAPALSSKTYSTVTLVEKTGVEYGISSDGEEYTWQSSNTFTGLSAYTSYYFAQRYSEDNIYVASGAGESIKVATYYADSDCYKVDISKVSDDAYVEAHNGKISYDADTKTLTLTNAEGTYTITGENSNITIQTAGGTVILDSVKCNGIVSSGDLNIKLSGDNAVSGGITVTGDLQLENQNTTGTAGSITITGSSAGAITANNITIRSGEVTATGTGEAAALKATETITLTGGSVTANAEVTPVQANKVVWIGTQVQSDSGIVFSVEPVDADGNLVNQCNVTYKDGTSVKTNFVRKDELFTLPSPKDPNGEHEGYKAVGWTVEGSEVILAVGSTQTVSADTVYVAVYTEITGSLQVSVADTDGLVYGYTTDAGVEVTITNNTNVTIDSIKAQLKDETKFTLSKTSITSLAAGESATLKVALKNGQSVNTYSTNLIITVSSKECDGDEVVINRTVIKKKLPTPTKTPTVQTVTDTSVTLVPVQDSDYTYQYGYKKTSDTSYKWQDSNAITGLLPYTAYDFALRYKETANASASDAGTAVSQTTLMSDAGKYVIDVSKLGDEDYIAAHGGTISVEGNGLTLEEEHTYTITGKNENLTVSALEDVTIVLDNAEISGITGSKNVILELKGTSKIDSKTENVSGITVTNKVTISQSEDADAASVTIQGGAGVAGINADEVVITSGTVSATGGENAAGIEGEKVTISGGTVQVTGSGDAPAIVAEEKDIADTVKLNNGDNYEEGGNENPGTPDPTPTPNPTPTPDPTPTPNPTPTPTPGPTPAQPSNPGNSTADTNTGDTTVDEADDEEDEEVITPALTAANILLQKGKSYTLTTNHEDVEITKISYVNSKSKKLVKVFSSGKIKAQKTGTAKLKVTYEYDGVSYNKNVTVKVQKNPVLVIAKKKLSITLKRKAKCNFVNPSNMLSSKGMKFKTSSKNVLTVSSKGMVTAKSKGTAKVTVTISGEKNVVNVKVK